MLYILGFIDFFSKKDTHGTLAFSGCYSAAHLFRLVPYSRLDSGMICFFLSRAL